MTSVITTDQMQTNPPNLATSQSRTFQLNPPALVRALVQSKIQELHALKKNEELLQVEVELRNSLKECKYKELQNISKLQLSDDEVHKIAKKALEFEVELEDIKI